LFLHPQARPEPATCFRVRTAVSQNQFPVTTITETGEQVLNTSAHAVMVIGTLAAGGLFSVQLEGAQAHKTGLQIVITGTDGVLRIINPRAFQNKGDNEIAGMRGEDTTFAPLPVPVEYQTLAASDIDVSSKDTGYLYAAYGRDRRNGTAEASNFNDTVALHRMIDQVGATSAAFLRKAEG